MSDAQVGDSTTSEADRIRREHGARRARFMLLFATVEAIVLFAAVVLIFVLRVIDPDTGVWVLVALAAVGATVLGTYLILSTRRLQSDLEALERR